MEARIDIFKATQVHAAKITPTTATIGAAYAATRVSREEPPPAVGQVEMPPVLGSLRYRADQRGPDAAGVAAGTTRSGS